MFWRHLSDAKLVEGSFGADLNTAGDPQTKDAAGFFVNSLYAPAAKFSTSYVAVASLFYSGTYGSAAGNIRGETENAFYFITQDANGLTGPCPYNDSQAGI
jgi:hypothetical protein